MLRKTIAISFLATAALINLQAALSDDRLVEPTSESFKRGRQIYLETCADCHGQQGQGVEGAYEDPLLGDDSVGQLAEVVAETMPEGEPELCVGEDAAAVAEFMHFSFYSEAAQVRNRPPRIGLARLTATQLRQSYADLYSMFGSTAPVSEEHGVSGSYFAGSRFKKENRKIERTDPVIDFDFGRESPGEGIEPEEFYIYWEGGLIAKETGRYEIVVDSSCSFIFEFGADNRELINNNVQSGDKTEFRRKVTLTAGRVYPFSIEYKQRKRKTELPPARISLRWVTPGAVERVIPKENLIPKQPPAVYTLSAELPPDDRSFGFERGVAINRQWDESTTAAAIEFSHIAHDELWPRYKRAQRASDEQRRDVLKQFLEEIVEAAFRRQLDNRLRQTYIDSQVAQESDDAEAIKRVLLLSLKSPRFLYPTLDAEVTQSQRVANRLALILYDSLPTDRELKRLVERGEFSDASQVRRYLSKRVNDYRVRAKTREFLHHWLDLDRIHDLAKSDELYPGFDAALATDLRRSLYAFIDEVVWSEESDFRELFNARWTYGTSRLADYYGETWRPEHLQQSLPSPSSLYRTVATDPDSPPPAQRYGLLTHPYLLSGLAYHDATSPIHRGVFLLRQALGRTIRPPMDAFSPLSPDLHPELTTRQRVELQTSPDSCQTCHEKINGLGFALENYDAVGRFRAEERQKPIDARGSYITRAGDMLEFSGPGELADLLRNSSDAQRAFVSKAFQHFVKQPPAAYGSDTLEQLTATFKSHDYSIRHLITEIAVFASLHEGEFVSGSDAIANKGTTAEPAGSADP